MFSNFLGFPSIQKEEFVYCSVHGYHYECAGHPQQFYMYVLFITIFILVLYVFCCIYNILWLTIPQLGTLSRVMRKYKKQLRKNSKVMAKNLSTKSRRSLSEGFFFAGEVFLAKKHRRDFVDEDILI